jgi:hypothetical protein
VVTLLAASIKDDPIAPPTAIFLSVENAADIFDTAELVVFMAPLSPVVN